jgi:hypothetical protein
MSNNDKFAAPTTEELESIKSDKFAAPTAAEMAAIHPPSETESFIRGAGQGLTMGFSDEALAAAKAVSTVPGSWKELKQAYYEKVAQERVADKAAQEANPWSYGGGQVVGGIGGTLVGGAGLLGAGVKGIMAAKGVPAMMKAGGLMGAVGGAGSAESLSPSVLYPEMVQGIALGAAAGGVMGGVGKLYGAGKELLSHEVPKSMGKAFMYESGGERVIGTPAIEALRAEQATIAEGLLGTRATATAGDKNLDGILKGVFAKQEEVLASGKPVELQSLLDDALKEVDALPAVTPDQANAKELLRNKINEFRLEKTSVTAAGESTTSTRTPSSREGLEIKKKELELKDRIEGKKGTYDIQDEEGKEILTHTPERQVKTTKGTTKGQQGSWAELQEKANLLNAKAAQEGSGATYEVISRTAEDGKPVHMITQTDLQRAQVSAPTEITPVDDLYSIVGKPVYAKEPVPEVSYKTFTPEKKPSAEVKAMVDKKDAVEGVITPGESTTKDVLVPRPSDVTNTPAEVESIRRFAQKFTPLGSNPVETADAKKVALNLVEKLAETLDTAAPGSTAARGEVHKAILAQEDLFGQSMNSIKALNQEEKATLMVDRIRTAAGDHSESGIKVKEELQRGLDKLAEINPEAAEAIQSTLLKNIDKYGIVRSEAQNKTHFVSLLGAIRGLGVAGAGYAGRMGYQLSRGVKELTPKLIEKAAASMAESTVPAVKQMAGTIAGLETKTNAARNAALFSLSQNPAFRKVMGEVLPGKKEK